MTTDYDIGAARLNADEHDDGVEVGFSSSEEFCVAVGQCDGPDGDGPDLEIGLFIDGQMSVNDLSLGGHYEDVVIFGSDALEHQVVFDRLERQSGFYLGECGLFELLVVCS